jgi:hypothetical protein
VQGGEHGQPRFAGHPAQRVHDQRGVGDVEARDGLVGQDELGCLGEDLGDGHALLLAPGERVGALPRSFQEADVRETPQRDLALGGVELPGEGRPSTPAPEMRQPPDEHVVEHPQALHEVELLEDHAHPRPVGLQAGSPQGGHVTGPDADHALADRHRAGETSE